MKAKQRADKPSGYFKDVSLESGTVIVVQWKERISVYLLKVFKQPVQKANKKHNVQDLQVKQQLFKETKATGTDTDDVMLKSVICSGISDSLKHKGDQKGLGGCLRSRLLWIETQNPGFPA